MGSVISLIRRLKWEMLVAKFYGIEMGDHLYRWAWQYRYFKFLVSLRLQRPKQRYTASTPTHALT